MTIRVMLLDDHPVVRAGLRAILDGFDDITVVGEGSDGSAALAEGALDGVDVVVCDIQMPGLDGIPTTRRLRELGGPPVLILTTYDTQADIVSGRRTLAPEVAAALAERIGRPQVALTTREIEILRALESGAGNRELARQLFISEATVKTHLVHIYQKLGVDNRTAAITTARDRRLI